MHEDTMFIVILSIMCVLLFGEFVLSMASRDELKAEQDKMCQVLHSYQTTLNDSLRIAVKFNRCKKYLYIPYLED